MNNKVLKRRSLAGLAVFNVILLAIYAASAVWGGIAYTASGIAIPDTGLTIPVLLFIVFSAGQVLSVAFNKPVAVIVLCAAKIIVFALSLYLLCRYAFDAAYIKSEKGDGFYSNFTYGILVISSAVTGAISAVFEVAAGVLILHGRR